MGIVASVTTAIIAGHKVKNWNLNWLRASGNVYWLRSCRMISGQKNAFQEPWKEMMATAAMAGTPSGSITRQKVVRKPAPSILAASSRSRGMVRKY